MYVITGATGNTGKRVAKALLALGRKVTVISRNADHVADLVKDGAIAAIGDLDDTAFLRKTFANAEAVYAMIPPKFDNEYWPKFQNEITKSLLAALDNNGVKHTVLLSSMGAHLPEGAAMISALHPMEEGLKHIKGMSSVALRAGYFMTNLYNLIGMMKHAGINGSTLRSDLKISIVHPSDIAMKAVEHLLNRNFSGHKVAFVAGPTDLTMQEVTDQINEVVGTKLPYISFSRADGLKGMIDAGLPPKLAEGYNEMENAMNEGKFSEGFTRTAENITPVTLKEFLENEFKPVFSAN